MITTSSRDSGSSGGGCGSTASSKVQPTATELVEEGQQGEDVEGTTIGDPLVSPEGRLQLLASTAAVTWQRHPQLRPYQIDSYTQAQQEQMKLQPDIEDMLMYSLTLLVQQLQAMAPQQRAAFLHSPAGNTVLHVLSEMCASEVMAKDVVRLVDSSTVQQVAQQAEEQPWPAEPDVVQHGLSGHAVVSLLVLPGLLLEPASSENVLQGSTHTSSYHNSSSSDRAAQRQDMIPTTTSSRSSEGAFTTNGQGSGDSSTAKMMICSQGRHQALTVADGTGAREAWVVGLKVMGWTRAVQDEYNIGGITKQGFAAAMNCMY
jgi:hypothetical protein